MHVEHGAELLDRQSVKIRWIMDPCVVHHDVQPTEGVDRRVDDGRRRPLVGHRRAARDGIPTEISDLLAQRRSREPMMFRVPSGPTP